MDENTRLLLQNAPPPERWEDQPKADNSALALTAEFEARLPTRLPSAPRETQQTISAWCESIFGPASSNARVAARANEEMAELLRALTADDKHQKAPEEMADVVIILYRLASRMGADLSAEVDRKMAVNRAREWKLDGTGHGYHVRKKEG